MTTGTVQTGRQGNRQSGATPFAWAASHAYEEAALPQALTRGGSCDPARTQSYNQHSVPTARELTRGGCPPSVDVGELRDVRGLTAHGAGHAAVGRRHAGVQAVHQGLAALAAHLRGGQKCTWCE